MQDRGLSGFLSGLEGGREFLVFLDGAPKPPKARA